VGKSWGSIGSWDSGNWAGNDWGVGNGLNDSWGLTVNNGVESVDWVSGVGDGTDGTIGLNKGVLSSNDISVTGLVGRLGVPGDGIRNGVSVVVLWMRIVRLGTGNNSLGHWGGIGEWSWSSVSYWSGVSDWTSISDWANSGSSNSH
jgi:hypothetical protein